jgi:hypothetical protein
MGIELGRMKLRARGRLCCTEALNMLSLSLLDVGPIGVLTLPWLPQLTFAAQKATVQLISRRRLGLRRSLIVLNFVQIVTQL